MSSAARSSLAGRSVSTPQNGARPERCINDVSADIRERSSPTVPASGVKLGVARRCGIKNLDIVLCEKGKLAERLSANVRPRSGSAFLVRFLVKRSRTARADP
jgi:hypothetical protein